MVHRNNLYTLLMASVLIGLAVSLVIAMSGCQQPAAFPKEFAQATNQIVTSMTDQAVWDKLAANVRGHVNNPGLRTGAGLEYFAYARLDGFDGDVAADATGTGSGQLTPEARAAILRLAEGDERYREWVLALFKGKAAPSPSPSPSPSPTPETPNQ